MLELHYNFFKKFCDTDKYEEFEDDTDSLYLALSEENLEDVILPEKNELNQTSYVLKIALITLLRVQPTIFFPSNCCNAYKKHDKREPGLFKEEFRCAEMLCLCVKTYCCYDRKSKKYKFSSKGLNK